MRLSAEKRLIYATCLFKESVFLRKSKLPLYQKLEVPESCSTLHHLIMVASCLQKIELWYPSFRLQTIDCDLGLFYTATAASQWRLVEIRLLATLGWKQGCQPFSCRCWQNVMHYRKEIYAYLWINHVDRLTCSRCDTLQNHILKQRKR